VPWSFDLIATRAIDMARHLNATIINEGDINTRRVKSVTSARASRTCWNISAGSSAGDFRRPS
jgi:BioD-like phosphotransacetylase family protein